jgi:chromosome segregation ATPase
MEHQSTMEQLRLHTIESETLISSQRNTLAELETKIDAKDEIIDNLSKEISVLNAQRVDEVAPVTAVATTQTNSAHTSSTMDASTVVNFYVDQLAELQAQLSAVNSITEQLVEELKERTTAYDHKSAEVDNVTQMWTLKYNALHMEHQSTMEQLRLHTIESETLISRQRDALAELEMKVDAKDETIDNLSAEISVLNAQRIDEVALKAPVAAIATTQTVVHTLRALWTHRQPSILMLISSPNSRHS